MSHICLYLGKGGCLLKIPFRYLEIIGWSESFGNPLIHRTRDRALLAPYSPLYRQPLVYIPYKKESALSTDVSMGSLFLDNACCFQFLRIASFFDCVHLHDSVIISAISSGIFLCRIVSLIIEQLAASSLVIVGALLVCSMANQQL